MGRRGGGGPLLYLFFGDKKSGGGVEDVVSIYSSSVKVVGFDARLDSDMISCDVIGLFSTTLVS